MNQSLLDQLPIMQVMEVGMVYGKAIDAAKVVVASYVCTEEGRALLNLNEGLLESKQSLEELVEYVKSASEEGVKAFNKYFNNHEICKDLLKDKVDQYVDDSELKTIFSLSQMDGHGKQFLYHHGYSDETDFTVDEMDEIVNQTTDSLLVKLGIPVEQREFLHVRFYAYMHHPNLIGGM